MNRFIRYWNQNRKKIIITIAIIAFIFLLTRLLNYIAKNNNESEENRAIIHTSKPIQSVITGENVSEEITDNNTQIIQQFIKACNEQKYTSAYELLTDDCKEQVFNNNINLFISNYCESIFQSKKTSEIDLWLNSNNMYTYRVKFYEDNLLATGGSQMNSNKEDYITINKDKININGFIEKEEINKSLKEKGIEIIINSKLVYKDYETYNITINNYSSKSIMISDGESSKDICLIDENKAEYPSFIHEILASNLSLQSGYQKNINIRFNKVYDIYRRIEQIKFSNIILDEEQYKRQESSIETTTIIIDI